jgi:N-acyl-D-amino-acid deacylase
VGIRGGRIEAVGRLEDAPARRVLTADALAVAPGFIDPHSHADLILAQEPGRAAELLRGRLGQGITTTLVGNCGMGAAPRTAESEPVLRGLNSWMTPAEVPWPWDDLAGFLDRLESLRLPLNVGALQAHGPLRIDAMGAGHGIAGPEAMDRMRRRLEAALEAGAFGASAGLIYPPGMYADTRELVELGRSLARHDAIFTFHIRGSSELLLPSVEEIVTVGRDSGCRVHHSHSEAFGRSHWPKIDEMLRREDDARAAGIRLSHDLFPYHAAATLMAALFPPWSLDGGMDALLDRLRVPAGREELRRAMEETEPTWPPWTEGGWPHNLVRAAGWDGIRVASVSGGSGGEVGRSLGELARERGTTPFEILAGLMLDYQGQVGQLIFGVSGEEAAEEPMARLLSHPGGSVCTDAEDLGRGLPHPAAYGAFPRVLGHWVRRRGLLSLPEAIRRMTSLPADTFGIRERGRIRAGYRADLVVFDPRTVADAATYDEPRESPRGIRHVLVNGLPAVEDGRYAPAGSGEVLRR